MYYKDNKDIENKKNKKDSKDIEDSDGSNNSEDGKDRNGNVKIQKNARVPGLGPLPCLFLDR